MLLFLIRGYPEIELKICTRIRYGFFEKIPHDLSFEGPNDRSGFLKWEIVKPTDRSVGNLVEGTGLEPVRHSDLEFSQGL